MEHGKPTQLQLWIGSYSGGVPRLIAEVNRVLIRWGLEPITDQTAYKWRDGTRSPRGKNREALYQLGFNRDHRFRDFLIERLREEDDYSLREVEAAYPLEQMEALAERFLDTGRQTLALARLAKLAGESLTMQQCTTWVGGATESGAPADSGGMEPLRKVPSTGAPVPMR
jgi:hypothetical protein